MPFAVLGKDELRSTVVQSYPMDLQLVGVTASREVISYEECTFLGRLSGGRIGRVEAANIDAINSGARNGEQIQGQLKDVGHDGALHHSVDEGRGLLWI